MAKLTALLLAGLFAVATGDQGQMSRLVWTTPSDNSKCTMKKEGLVLTSGDCVLQTTSDDSLSTKVTDAMAGMEDLITDVNSLKSEVADLESYMHNFDDDIHRRLCESKVTPTTLTKFDGARIHGDAFCRYDCKTGFHDAHNVGDCFECLETCNPGYKLTGACTTTTKPTCELDTEYCPAALPSDLVVPEATALPVVNARSIGHTLNVACKESKYQATITCGADRKWTVDGSCKPLTCTRMGTHFYPSGYGAGCGGGNGGATVQSECECAEHCHQYTTSSGCRMFWRYYAGGHCACEGFCNGCGGVGMSNIVSYGKVSHGDF